MSLSSSIDLSLQATVKDKLTAIFRRHGAVERADSPALLPFSSHYYVDDVVSFVNSSGKLMQLPYDLVLPNAMLLVRQPQVERKTFIFGKVYRLNHAKDQPRIFEEANFDILSEKDDNLALREAEVIKVVDEVLDAFPNLASSQMCYHINHSELLDCILNFCSIDRSKWLLVKEALSKLRIGDYGRFPLQSHAIDDASKLQAKG